MLVKSYQRPNFEGNHSFKLWNAESHVGFRVRGGNVPMTEFIQVSTTVNSKERANKIARKLLDERVASRVQVLSPT